MTTVWAIVAMAASLSAFLGGVWLVSRDDLPPWAEMAGLIATLLVTWGLEAVALDLFAFGKVGWP